MGDFTLYGNEFDEDLENLEKVLKICKQTNFSLSIEKWNMIMNEGVFIGNYISYICIQVGPAKIEVILKISTPKTKKIGTNLFRTCWLLLLLYRMFFKTSSLLF